MFIAGFHISKFFMVSLSLLLEVSIGVTLLLALPGEALAGESLFSRAYTTETVPEGHFELEQAVRMREGRSFGNYVAFDFKSEFEYGITDNFQGALYINTGTMNAFNSADDNDPNGETGFTRNNAYLSSIAVEFIYRIASPVKDFMGIALYYEPEYDFYDIHNGDKDFNGISNEFRVILQKDFFNDQLILVYNVALEAEFFRYGDRDTLFLGELDWNNEVGASWRVGSNIYAGLELRNHNEFGNFYSHDHSVYWAGPALHYGGPRFWATLGVLKEVYGNPDGYDGEGSYLGSGLFLHSHENIEITAKAAVTF